MIIKSGWYHVTGNATARNTDFAAKYVDVFVSESFTVFCQLLSSRNNSIILISVRKW